MSPSEMARILGAKIIGNRAQMAHLAAIRKQVKDGPNPADPAITRPHPGMRYARVLAPIFAGNSTKNVEYSREALEGGVIGLMLEDIAWLRAYPNTPPIYESGVIYKPEKHRVDAGGHTIEYGEDWQTVPWIIHHGFGDCEDLGAWRAAELRLKGVAATPLVKVRRMPDGAWRAHVQVRLPDGRIEDPAANLGMYSYA